MYVGHMYEGAQELAAKTITAAISREAFFIIESFNYTTKVEPFARL